MPQEIQPRAKYNFDGFIKGESKHFTVADMEAGAKILNAAYAYGRRNSQQFCGQHTVFRGKMRLTVRRVK